jgi:hypothetical protein
MTMRFHRFFLAAALALASFAATAAAALPSMVVYKDAYCSCCKAWVDYMRKQGFQVEVRETDGLDAVKKQAGVPDDQRSCHTARIGGYFVEGHVPADDVRRLLKEKPKARGIAVAGMPMGSPGMEVPDGRTMRYDVVLVKANGTTQVFAHH